MSLDDYDVDKIWMDGELTDWGDAKIHVLSHVIHYGSGVFEGIRCYDTEEGAAVFRHEEHYERLHNSAKLFGIDLEYS
ncbi:MAG: branched-chain amino acid transaminase, partial [Halobacteria archaeon]|nr:branched-chain amino acid transaminase [Halobacteria archaeon]